MSEKKLFSIILPTYNVSKYVRRCIESIQKQSFSEFEMIFVDDCSSDDSLSIITKYAQVDHRIKIVKHLNNLGTYHARFSGAKAAVGEYLLFIDPDDEIKKDLLLKLSTEIIKKPDIVFYGVDFQPSRPWYKKKAFLQTHSNNCSMPEAIYKKSNNEFLWGATPGKCFKREFYIGVLSILDVPEDFRFVYAEDQLVIYCSYFLTNKVSNLNYDGYVYYKNESSISKIDRSTDMTFQLEQYNFFLVRLYSTVSNMNLRLSSQVIFDRLFVFLKSNYYLISRHHNGSKDYFKCLRESNRLDFKIRKIVALIVYVVSFKRIGI